jgi:aminoglycoside phosphotransferase family enzyme
MGFGVGDTSVPPVSLAQKIDFLRQPDSFPDQPQAIEVVETHFAWVFLSRRYAYKLKKPLRFQELDISTLAKRKANCAAEVRLNRRLAERVYIDAVPLTLDAAGLHLEGAGQVVEWLVKMIRLPYEDTLHARAVSGRVDDANLTALIDKLVSFYARAAKAPWHGGDYTDFVRSQIMRYGAELARRLDGTDAATAQRLLDALLDWLTRHGEALAQRSAAGHVVDAHGDLRPEHVFLNHDPQIIDCLEFSQTLRWLDSAEEISFLDLECERAGYAQIGHSLSCRYRDCHDPALDPGLYRFYRSRRGLVRALLAVWRLGPEGSPVDNQRWLAQARWYLNCSAADIRRSTGCGNGPRGLESGG